MYKYYLFLLSLALGSCKNDENSTPTLSLARQGNEFTVSLEDIGDQACFLLVNGKRYDSLNIRSANTIGINYLKPGQNLFQLVMPDDNGPDKADTLSDSAFFSYDISYHLVKTYNHDIQNFTEGLFLDGTELYESTGLEGKSGIFKYKIGTQELEQIKSIRNADIIFGEGIASVKNSLYQLTWKNRVVFEYDKHTWKKKKEFKYANEGWGLTPNGDSLIASDGSEFLYFINPSDFSIYNKLAVTGAEGPVRNINELELVGNIVVANIWQSHTLIFIDKVSGMVLGTADLTALFNSARQENPKIDVLNGIAYDPTDGSFLVTGKFWPKLYRIKFDDNFEKLRASFGER